VFEDNKMNCPKCGTLMIWIASHECICPKCGEDKK